MQGEQLLIEVCPFCNKQHTLKNVLNVVCECNSKFYIFDGFWLNRGNGDRVELHSDDKAILEQWIRNQLKDIVK